MSMANSRETQIMAYEYVSHRIQDMFFNLEGTLEFGGRAQLKIPNVSKYDVGNWDNGKKEEFKLLSHMSKKSQLTLTREIQNNALKYTIETPTLAVKLDQYNNTITVTDRFMNMKMQETRYTYAGKQVTKFNRPPEPLEPFGIDATLDIANKLLENVLKETMSYVDKGIALPFAKEINTSIREASDVAKIPHTVKIENGVICNQYGVGEKVSRSYRSL